MTTRSNKGVRLETDIEKCREESNWKKVIELSDQLKAKNNNQVHLYSFLLGEGKLESFFEECPPIESNINRAKSGLQEAKRCLESATCEQGDKAGVALDSHLLLGKLHYAMGLYEEALGHFVEADLQGLTERPLPSRSLKIIAESFAVKGLCLEKVPPSSTSKYKQAEWEDQMMRCFELAGDLALLYLQELDKLIQPPPSLSGTIDRTGGGGVVAQPPTRTESNNMGPILETALQRSPFLHLNARRLPQAVNRYRKLLSAVESSGTHSLRLNLTRQLAEVLIRGFTGANYTAPTSNGNKKSAGPWKPQLYTGPNMFVPRSENEELILLLLISEAMAVREAVLSQSPEFKDARVKALSNAIAVYDLLAVVLVRWGQVSLLNECLEHALKFSFEEAQVWMQRALCLDSMGLHVQALAVLKQVTRMLPNKVLPCLMAARICYQNLNNMEEGIEWSEKGLQREVAHPQGLLSRCHLYIAVGSHYAGLLTHLKSSKQAYIQACTDHLIKAQGMDPSDHLIEYYTGLSVGCRGQVSEALSHAKAALTLCPEHAPSLHLTVLLLTAQKQYPEAHALLKTALADFPDSIDLHYVKAHLDLHTYGPEAALVTAKHMLVLWKCQFEEQTLTDQSDNKSVFQLYTCEMSDKDSNSVHGASAAASRVEQALSEVASSLSGFTPRPGPHHAWLLQLHIWLLLAEIYLSMDQVDQAAASIQEATNIYPMSHHIMFTRGLVHEHKKEFTEAKQCFQNAVSINPFHIKSLQHLGLMYLYLGNQRMAEKTLRDAARIDPHSPQTWYNLGKVLESLGDHQRASDCMATALQVETLSPILAYNTIPITFN